MPVAPNTDGAGQRTTAGVSIASSTVPGSPAAGGGATTSSSDTSTEGIDKFLEGLDNAGLAYVFNLARTANVPADSFAQQPYEVRSPDHHHQHHRHDHQQQGRQQSQQDPAATASRDQ